MIDSSASVDSSAELTERAIRLAAELLEASRRRETAAERERSARMARMIEDEPGKRFTIALADQVLRVEEPRRAAQRLSALLAQYGTPRYLSWLDRRTIEAGAAAARLAPGLVMPAITSRVRKDSNHVIVPAEDGPLDSYLSERRSGGIRVNFNQLGEAVLGEAEALRRLETYRNRLLEPRIDYLSVKLSAVASQISLTGYRATVDLLAERLRILYRAAMQSGTERPKFVNLDMEEYRDLSLTIDVFRRVLDEPEFERLEAGIVLQAYIPDSASRQRELTEWAIERQRRTGAGIKLRLVKGANLAMEQVEASLRGWEQAVYATKLEVDANWKRMLRFACEPQHLAAVRVGVASHNLFDIAYAFLLRETSEQPERIEFEMLEGMANAQAFELRSRAGSVLFYVPVVKRQEFESAVAYLVRRLDENTAPGSFLGALFALREGSDAWNRQREAFVQACRLSHDPTLSDRPRRQQDRHREKPAATAAGSPFDNVADTDFSLPANRAWLEAIDARWRELAEDPNRIGPVPLQVGGATTAERTLVEGHDPSRPGVVAYRYAIGNEQDVETALATAHAAIPAWSGRGIAGRADVLRQVAVEFAKGRGELIGCMTLDGGKGATEADVEVSEAIDFAEYYARSLDDPAWFDGTEPSPIGIVVVTPPWNFPYAIPAGGVLAALMAGNSVILKPAPEAVLTAWYLVRQFWDAGVPRDVLQFLPLADGDLGRRLLTDDRVGTVILTGGYPTARLFESWKPSMRLMAETSGKNAMIITATADVDLAVRDLVRGAFGHAGQKCSATSLALVEASVYDDPKFRRMLKEATESLPVGSAWNRSSIVTPVIRPPGAELLRGLTQLDAGESWLVEPKMIDGNPCLWSPGIRWDVRRGSWYHRTECFGPVLGVIRVADLDEAIAVQNENEFGLTGGLQSLDVDEIRKWVAKVEVGNAYVNRGTTGAIVRRQPFGGWKHSCVGPGSKAGGPNYVAALAKWRETGLPKLRRRADDEIARRLAAAERLLGADQAGIERLRAGVESQAQAWATEFSRDHDPSRIHGESNCFRYRARPWTLVRCPGRHQERPPVDLLLALFACRRVGATCEASLANDVPWRAALAEWAGITVTVESDAALAERLSGRRDGTLRLLGDAEPETLAAARRANLSVLDGPAYANGRLELTRYLREQAISRTMHRYGNLQSDPERS
ncbi:MAG TPA: proline dehydrogenase family protein [Pirellulaceae bacterium]|nr:proline dehydrogenase family protein [Pirellulaceae bacterium]